ncbi:MAG TPA: hypothetical protein VGO47_07510 [Chlamydiales bacterium]|nr:hypothetical protein [Chlamydiales bacterium]
MIVRATDSKLVSPGNGTTHAGSDASSTPVHESPVQTTKERTIASDVNEKPGKMNSILNAAGRTLERVSTFSVVATVNGVAEPVWTSPYLENAIQVLEQLSDVARTLPFVAPAFMLFKIIIEVEQRAKDVDIKCRDLIERITFMLGHMAALKGLEVPDSTKHVVGRITEALKSSAALIEAYRRQRPLARRLSLNNRQKFVECAQVLTTCTNDLLVSLQIHQAGQIEILTRSVPVDPGDQSAKSFLDKNGSLDNVKNHPELVSEYAKQHHFVMDELAMEQLNSNVSDAIEQNHMRLDSILKENVGAVVIDGITALAHQMDKTEMEQKLVCVQCGSTYRNSTNGAKSCSFHKWEYSSWTKNYGCCSSDSPCQFQYHRSKHHCDYPYGSFVSYARGILGYSDTKEDWAVVNDADLEENDKEQDALVGQLYRWKSQGERILEPTIVIKVGTVWQTDTYYFDTFSSKELKAVAAIVSLTGRTLIFRTKNDDSEFTMAEWILSNGTITGVRLSAKAATSATAFICECPIDIDTCKKSGEVVMISKGGLRSYTPDRVYELPETVRISPQLMDKPIREVRKDFKTRTTSNLAVILRAMSNPPLKAKGGGFGDSFEGEMTIFNNHLVNSQNFLTIASFTAAYRFVGDEEYNPLPDFEIKNASQLPVTIEPRQSWTCQFSAYIKRSQEENDLRVSWWTKAFLARYRPLRLKLTAQDMSGEECSLVMEYVFEPFSVEGKKLKHIEYFYIDNPDILCRRGVEIENPDPQEGHILKVGGTVITVKWLQQVTYRALKTGETELDLEIGRSDQDGSWEWKWTALALVDLSCCRVYAIKVLVVEGPSVKTQRFACLGYIPVPEYGDVIDIIRPIQYANETVKLPELEPYITKEYPIDDAFDDFVPEPPRPAVPEGSAVNGGGSGQGVLWEELNGRLASIDGHLVSIDNNLARIAGALELVASKAQ